MKVLFVSNFYPPKTIGGYERLCHEVATAFVEAEHEVAVLTSTPDGSLRGYPGQRIHRTLQLLTDPVDIYAPFSATSEERAAIDASNIVRLQRVLALERPDVVFVWNLYFLSPSFLTALDQSGVAIAFMLTDNWMIATLDAGFIAGFFRDHAFGDEPFPGHATGWRRVFRKRSRPAVRFNFQHKAIFGSDFMRRLYEAAGVSFGSSRVIHNGVRLARMPDGAFADRTTLRDPSEARLLCAGRLVDLKGVHTAIEALPGLRDEQPPVRLTILGDAQDGAYKRRLDSLIDATGTADRIEFRSPVTESELFNLFQEHDIYLFPSLYEPFSLTLIYALAAGIPTVASDAGGNVEIIHHRRTGLLFRKGDAQGLAAAIRILLKEPKLRHSLSSEARRVAHEFSFERMVREMALYIAERA
jgi:glycosyltransferase involved in cell wall biosynthesis